jgi:hypothetical protein
VREDIPIMLPEAATTEAAPEAGTTKP